jgi:hypothetical protein
VSAVGCRAIGMKRSDEGRGGGCSHGPSLSYVRDASP